MSNSLLSRLVRKLARRSLQGSKWELSSPLLSWSEHDPWTVGNAVEGTLDLGATGSGKSSASGRAIALATLKHGFGGLVLTVKPDERASWERYCAETGRSDDLVVFAPESPWRFNFLEQERSRSGSGAGLTENIVNLLSNVLEVSERQSGGSARDDEGYWRRATRQLMRNAVELLLAANGRVSVPDLYRLVISAPTALDQRRSEEWKARSFCFHCLREAEGKPRSARQQSDFEIVADYFWVEFPSLADKTRSIVVSTFTSMIDVLNRGVLREAFCTDTTLSLESIEQGKIVVVDFPVKEYGEIGVFAQVLVKYAWQRHIERRNVAENPRPVFLFIDEAQHFLTSYDQLFQTTCRSARVATVLLTQNISNVYAALGGSDKGKAEANSLFANLNTRILHANSDPVTNEWAASIIGRTLQTFANGGTSTQKENTWAAAMGLEWLSEGSRTTSAGFSEHYEYDVQPSAFTTLRTGGPANDWLVDGIVVQNGRTFEATGRSWVAVCFEQAQRMRKGRR